MRNGKIETETAEVAITIEREIINERDQKIKRRQKTEAQKNGKVVFETERERRQKKKERIKFHPASIPLITLSVQFHESLRKFRTPH